MSKKTTEKKNSPLKLVNADAPEIVSIDRTADLKALLEENIKCLYWVENHLVKALPKMVSAAGRPELRQAFSEHLSITVGHVARLEQVFELLGKKILAKKSDALEGLAMDGEHIIEETMAGSDARNTGLIMAGQLVENYEITAYTGVIKLATQLGLSEIADILSKTLAEEQEAENRLRSLA